MTHTVRGLFDAYWSGRIEEIAQFVEGDENINMQDADGRLSCITSPRTLRVPAFGC